MFYKTLIASFALHLAVVGGVALVGTGGSSAPRADEVLSVDLKEAFDIGKGDGTASPAFHKRPEAASLRRDETPSVPSAPSQPEADSFPPLTPPLSRGGKGGTDSAGEARIASRGPSAETKCETNNDALSKIREAIERAKSYPLIARKRGLEGTVLLGFHISESGTPMDIRVAKSSGYRVLDGEAIKIVKRASPYPPLGRTVDVPISFRLK